MTGLLAAVPASAFAHGYHRPYERGRVAVVVGPRGGVYLAPRLHRSWVPGYWSRRGPRAVWIEGAWAAPPHDGWVWVAPRWAWEGGRWVWREGTWVAPAPYATSGYVPAPQPGYVPAQPGYVPDQGYAPAPPPPPAPAPSGYTYAPVPSPAY